MHVFMVYQLMFGTCLHGVIFKLGYIHPLEHLLFDVVETLRLLSAALKYAAGSCYPSYPTVQLEALLLSNYDLEPVNQPFSISPSSHSHLPPITTDFNKVNFWDSSGAGSWRACLLCLVWLHLIICIDCRGASWLTSVNTSPRLVWKWPCSFPHCLPQFPSRSCAVVETLNWDSQHLGLKLTHLLLQVSHYQASVYGTIKQERFSSAWVLAVMKLQVWSTVWSVLGTSYSTRRTRLKSVTQRQSSSTEGRVAQK